MARSASTWPAARMRSASVLPDLSSVSSRVSDTVSTAILSGTNCRVSSMPGITVSLKRCRRESIAGGQFALREAGGEPALALFCRAVGKRVRHDTPLHLFLQRVVADGARGLQRRVDVTGIEKLPALL